MKGNQGMQRIKSYLVVSMLVLVFLFTSLASSAYLPMTSPEKVGMSSSILASVDSVINDGIANKNTPGAVLLVGHQGKIVYKKAYGNRMVKPRIEKMTVDTIFDMASLTKPTATACGIMKLYEEGKLDVHEKAAKYFPEFAQNGKENITIANLLTHTSGLKPDGDYYEKNMGYDGIIKNLAEMNCRYTTGAKFVYSDLGFMTLGEIIRRVSGKPENEFVAAEIYKPLGLKDTGYLPPKNKWKRCAPTEFRHGELLQGQVHDPTAWEMKGVAGHAGLFSTADDMAVICQMFLNNGEYNGVRIFKPETIKLMTTNQSPIANQERGFGWDIGSSYSSQRGQIFPKEGYGHTGWTGTSVWVDPASQTFVILLCNRNHPDGKGNVGRLRSQVSNIVATSIAKD
jgi:CubicO group peptidase (beta-lactamase class C family)